MEGSLKIVAEGGTGEVVEKKSRFIASVFPIQTEEEALGSLSAHGGFRTASAEYHTVCIFRYVCRLALAERTAKRKGFFGYLFGISVFVS